MTTKILTRILIFFIIIVSFSSCIRKILLKDAGVYEKKITIKKITNGEKELIFFPMHHIGKKEFYEDAISKLEFYKLQGYYVYFEGLSGGGVNIDTAAERICQLKLRSITGLDLVKMKMNSGYIGSNGISNSQDKKLNSIIIKDNFVNQPNQLKSPKDTIFGKRVDGNIIELIKAYENKFGEINLTDYDKSIALGQDFDKSKNKKIDKEKRNYIVIYLRNVAIVNSIVTSPRNKIVLVYGENHYKGILELLQDFDKKYK